MFLRPTNDFAFKKLFGNEQHTEAVVSFINAVLGNLKIASVVSVELFDREQLGTGLEGKSGIGDVRCRDDLGRSFKVLMQIVNDDSFMQGLLFDWARVFGSQLIKGEFYDELEPVYVIAIANLEVFRGESFLSSHQILSIESGACHYPWLGFTFVELPKFDKSLDELSNLCEKWIYFLKSIHCHDRMPSHLSEPIFREAGNLLREMALSELEYTQYEKIEMAYQVIEVNKRKLIKDAEARGKASGRMEEKLEVLHNLFNSKTGTTFSIEELAQITGLTIEEIIKEKEQFERE